jgi:hypothetical protein
MTEVPDLISPTPERMRRGSVALLERQIERRDETEFGIPHIAIDLLVRMEGNNRINRDERVAGERFRDWFRLAQLDSLKAADMARPYVDGGGAIPELEPHNERARNEITRAIRWVGGIGSSAGSCLWHVIGLDESLRKWAILQSRSLDHKGAAVILAIALERLARMPWRGPHENTP